MLVNIRESLEIGSKPTSQLNKAFINKERPIQTTSKFVAVATKIARFLVLNIYKFCHAVFIQREKQLKNLRHDKIES